MDYLRPYSLAHPVQSFTVLSLSKDPEPQYGYEDNPPTPEGTYAFVVPWIKAFGFLGVERVVLWMGGDTYIFWFVFCVVFF